MAFQGIGIGPWDAFLPILELHVSCEKRSLVVSEMNSEHLGTGDWFSQTGYALSCQENPQDYGGEQTQYAAIRDRVKQEEAREEFQLRRVLRTCLSGWGMGCGVGERGHVTIDLRFALAYMTRFWPRSLGSICLSDSAMVGTAIITRPTAKDF